MERGLAIERHKLTIASVGAKEESIPDSMKKDDYECCFDWSVIRILMHELEAIYRVFLSTPEDTIPLINLSQRYLRKRLFSRAIERSF